MSPAASINPHLDRSALERCPDGACDGSGFVVGEDDVARPCSCRPQRIARARTRSLEGSVPKKFQHVGFDRFPVTNMEPTTVREVRRFCDTIDEQLEAGRGLYFFGTKGTGKTTLAMLVSQYAMRAKRTVAIYTTPWLLSHIRSTYEEGAKQTYLELMDRIASADLLHLEDMAVAKQSEWMLEQLYTIVNRRYEDERSILLTADVESPERLGEHIGDRTTSRIVEMCQEIAMFGDDHRVTATAAAG